MAQAEFHSQSIPKRPCSAVIELSHQPGEPPGPSPSPLLEERAGERRPVDTPILNSIALPLLIVGPTAVGKSEIALSLAERVGGEIISADSMQVYRGMDIGTAKPTPKDQARVRNHLVDV